MSEENLRAALRRPWVGISSDGASMAPEGAFLRAPTHPRAYGSFARVLGHYVRDEKVLPLADAIRRMNCSVTHPNNRPGSWDNTLNRRWTKGADLIGGHDHVEGAADGSTPC
jgi:hypothetical protein